MKPCEDELSDEFLGVDERLKNAWLRRIAADYDRYNRDYLKSALQRPALALSGGAAALGYWNATTRTIYISVRHIESHLWEAVRATLRHEMAHQYVTDVLQPKDETAHGPSFKEACHLLRCDSGASAKRGSLTTLEASEDESDKIVVKIRKLLALGGSPNQHEADSAMRMASKLLLKYNVDLHTDSIPMDYISRSLGKPQKRFGVYYGVLGHVLLKHFFVRAIYLHSYDAASDTVGKILEISGTPLNVEIAEYVHDYLLQALDALWAAHRRETGASGSAKAQYLAGLMAGFREKLDAQSSEIAKSTDLIWVGGKALDDYWKHRYPRTRKSGGSGVRRTGDYDAGVAQGKNITIRRGAHQRSGGPTKLITG